MADYHPALDAFATAFGLPATVLPAGASSAMVATVIWDAYRPAVDASADVVDFDSDWISVRRDEIADLQPGDTVTAARVAGQPVATFRVVRVARHDPEWLQVAVQR